MVEGGVMEDGGWPETEAGTPQGAVISPLLSNVYLPYVLDQWRRQAAPCGNYRIRFLPWMWRR
jgi:RNA-directed DNA polymerase